MKILKQNSFELEGVKVVFIALLFLLFPILNTNAQEAVTASGGDASGTGGSVSYSVGQVVYTTVTGTGGSVAQGVQQPYEISVSTAVENTEDIILITAYPNPVKDILKLRTDKKDFETVMYQLFDMKGKLVKEEKVAATETSIDMQSLSPSVYFLKVIEGDKEIKTFKITKK